ncbi:ABC transporter [Erysipelothrix larvae]|uniref:ABC transporter n=1 Tax=Erysipelothrix larvae TaxID=1514105 RepID=A0A0X8GZL1_9FIRM|nr:ATP-binding cassette domain-containing protein [Erysipelothrix larvae]AMC93149.1 ABC transporter [Erysipelothrix larvae]
MSEKILLKVDHLQKFFPLKKKSVFQKEVQYVRANKDISINIHEGETLGLVGESGCGKSTFGRTLIQLYDQTGGVSLYYGDTIESMMPSYVEACYKSIPKVFKGYKHDLEKLKEIEKLAAQETGTSAVHVEELRHAKIDFEKKYGNILRLAGGLLVHSNLDEVKSVLLEKYHKGSAVSKYIKGIEFETTRLEARGEDPSKSTKISGFKSKLDQAEKELVSVDEKVEKLKDSLRSNPEFDTFESMLDNGIDLSSLTKTEMRDLRKDLQIIFQDPYSSLDPRFTVGNIIGEGLVAHGIFDSNKSEGYQEYIEDIMQKCGLAPEYIHRYPHQFSGGQRQRIGIARALALNPRFIVCDEAVSALDVSIQSQVINLLQDLKDENNLTYLFITHDLGVVRFISDRIGVMYFGNLVELAPAEEIFDNPQHPYTRQLLNAIPKMTKPGEIIEPLPLYTENDVFDFGFKETGEADNDWHEVSPGHFVACRLKNKESV